MTFADARLWEMVEKAARSVTDDSTGQFDNKSLVDELQVLLEAEETPEHVRVSGVEILAKSLARTFVSKRNPKPGKATGMFHPEGILPLGDGKRVWMEYATDRDLIEWARQSTKNLARVASAEGARQAYVSERLEAFRDHAGWLLGRIEREVFGFVPVVEDPPDYGDEDDEGGA